MRLRRRAYYQRLAAPQRRVSFFESDFAENYLEAVVSTYGSVALGCLEVANSGSPHAFPHQDGLNKKGEERGQTSTLAHPAACALLAPTARQSFASAVSISITSPEVRDFTFPADDQV